MRISFAVTPFAVAPPLSPSQYGTHGGDCASSTWRGGPPMHAFRALVSMTGPLGGFCAVPGGSVVVVAPPPPPSPAPDPLPPLAEPLCDVCSGGACFSACTASGAYSAVGGGGGCDGRRPAATSASSTMDTSAKTAPGPFAGRPGRTVRTPP